MHNEGAIVKGLNKGYIVKWRPLVYSERVE